MDFMKHTCMSKLLRIGVLYLNNKLAAFRRSVNCQVSNQWRTRNEPHIYQYLIHEINAGNGCAGSRTRIAWSLFYNESCNTELFEKLSSSPGI